MDLPKLNVRQLSILKAIREAGGSISFTDLVTKTGLTRKTINKCSKDLKNFYQVEEIISFKNGKQHLFRLKTAKPQPTEVLEIRKVEASVRQRLIQQPILAEKQLDQAGGSAPETIPVKARILAAEEQTILQTVLRAGIASKTEISNLSGIPEEETAEILQRLVDWQFIEKAFSIEDGITIIFRKKFGN